MGEGSPKERFAEAMAIEEGRDTLPDAEERVMELLRSAAEDGYAPAQNYYGFKLYGRGDANGALDWLTRAAMQGDGRAYNNLGYLLMDGEGVEHDYARAAEWFERARELGSPTAMAMLGDLYAKGLGVEQDSVQAVRLYEEAISRGLRDAELKLIALDSAGWSELGQDEALERGRRYYLGGAPVAGAMLLERAAEFENPEALALLGDAYSRGNGVEYSHAKSIEYFYRAAQGGNPSAQFVVGELLDMFPDAIEGAEGAQYWYDAAAGHGVTDAAEAWRQLTGGD